MLKILIKYNLILQFKIKHYNHICLENEKTKKKSMINSYIILVKFSNRIQ